MRKVKVGPQVSLRSAVSSGSAQLHIVDAGGHYQREAAPLTNEHLLRPRIREGYKNLDGHAPPSGIAWFDNAIVLPNGTLILESGEVISESIENGADRWLPPEYISIGETLEAATLVTKVGARNYGHFIVEMLPRIMQVESIVSERNPLLLSKLSKGFAEQVIYQATGRNLKCHYLNAAPVLVKRLCWPIRNTFHPVNNSPLALDTLSNLRMSSGRKNDRKLFLTRRDAPNRRLINEESVFETLEPLGFEWVSPGNMSFREQIDVFSQSNLIVGVAGAALTNLVFMPEGSRVGMLAPQTMAGFFFWDICFHRSIAFGAAFGENTDARVTDKNADFSINEKSVHELLEQLSN